MRTTHHARTAALIALAVSLSAGTRADSVSSGDAGAEKRLANRFLSVSYQPSSGALRLTNAGAGQPFLDGAFTARKPGAAALVESEIAGVGRGRALEITYQDGSKQRLTLLPDVPFVCLQTFLRNGTQETQRIDRLEVLDARILPGVASEGLKALGTGGLTPVGQKPNTRRRNKNPAPVPATAEDPGGSYMFLAVAEPQTRNGVVGAWLSSDRGSGVLFYSQEAGQTRMRARTDYGRLILPPQTATAGEVLLLGQFDDARLGLEAYAELVARYYAIHLKPPLEGYCTWYSRPNGGACTEDKLLLLARAAAEQLKPFGFDFVQIDDKWQEGVYTNGPRKVFGTHRKDGPYPQGMKPIADQLKALGLIPGLWWMPFAGTWNDPSFADKAFLFARNPDGTPYVAKWGGTAFDLTNPKVLDYVGSLAGRLAGEWGYRYFKLDGLWMGTSTRNQYGNNEYEGDDDLGKQVVFNPGVTPIEAYRLGLKKVREAAGPDVFLLGCNISQNMRSFGASFGLLDAMRIGPDNKAEWKSLVVGPWHGANRYFLNGRVWHNDPDPLYVRNDMPLEHAQAICSWVALSGQINVFSEWLPDLQPERVRLLQRTLPNHGLPARPADLLEVDFPRIWVLADPKSELTVVGVFNWSDTEPAAVRYPLDRLGVTAPDCRGFEYWTDSPLDPVSGRLEVTVPAGSCRVLALRPAKDYPQVISTSRHITQGVIDLKEQSWNAGRRTLSGVSKLVANDPYELRIVLPKGQTCELRDVSAQGAAVVSQTTAAGLVRVTLKSERSGDATWAVRF